MMVSKGPADSILNDVDTILEDTIRDFVNDIAEPGEPATADARPTNVTATIAFVPSTRTTAPDTTWGTVSEIYITEYNSLVRLAYLFVHDQQTAEEVVQDSFVAMHSSWRRLRDQKKALAYLRQAVANRSRSVLRHRTVVDKNAPKPAPDEPSAESGAITLLEREQVVAALRRLPERQRQALVLRYYGDFSEAEIATAMGISKGAVKSHTARGMAALKSIIAEQETS